MFSGAREGEIELPCSTVKLFIMVAIHFFQVLKASQNTSQLKEKGGLDKVRGQTEVQCCYCIRLF